MSKCFLALYLQEGSENSLKKERKTVNLSEKLKPRGDNEIEKF